MSLSRIMAMPRPSAIELANSSCLSLSACDRRAWQPARKVSLRPDPDVST
jgi:hypothetical protein